MKAKAIALVLAMLIVSIGLLAQQDPAIGTWKLNLAKSKYSPGPAPKALTFKLEPYGNGGSTVTGDGVDAQGAPNHVEWSVQPDGKDYPVKGSQLFDTVSTKRINPSTTELSFKKGGKPTTSGRAVVSKDGKTMTVRTTGTNAQSQRVNNVAVYDKQ